MAGHKVPNAIKFPTIRRVGIDSDLQEKMTHLQHKSCRDDILVAVYNRNGMSHASDDIVMVVKKKTVYRKIPKSKLCRRYATW